MNITHIPFQETGFFSKMMKDYLNKDEMLNNFYGNFPDIQGFEQQLLQKRNSFPIESRTILADVLDAQYHGFEISERTSENIRKLRSQNTFTVTTGHQLNLFTGPLYFLYKIISTINLAERLKEEFPDENFVPIYWMATEDHDFEEINFFNFRGEKFQWHSQNLGAVGRFDTKGLDAVYEEFKEVIGTSQNADYLKDLFSEAYFGHKNLADSTRYIANKLFARYGLVVLDADDTQLKQCFTPFLKQELEHETSHKEVSKTIVQLEKSYKIQVNPREINLFYLTKSARERIVYDGTKFKINNTNIEFTTSEILKEVETNPQDFSPNVIMRPLYQEVILPNLCYIGGGGELAYWMQLKSYFKAVDIPFPILLLRNSVQVFSEKQVKRLLKLNLNTEEIFKKQRDLIAEKVIENSDLQIDFEQKKRFLEKQFSELKESAIKTDVTFLNAVNAQERKQIKGLEVLEKRLLKAEKRRQKVLVERIESLQNDILPNQGLEERQRNFSEYYLTYGALFITALKDHLDPLALEFTLLEM